MKNKVVLIHFGRSISAGERSNFFKKILSKEYDVELIDLSSYEYSNVRRIIKEIEIFTHLIRGNYQIIHLNDMSYILPFFISILKFKKNLIIYDTGNIHFETVKISGHSKVVVLITKWAEKRIIEKSDYIISRGIYLQRIIKQMRSGNENIYYIPDPIDVKEFSESKVILQQKNDLYFKDNFLIGYTSNFVSIRIGSKFLPRGWEIVEILSKFKENGITRVKAFFIGKGDALDDLKRLAKNKGVESMCVFTGYLKKDEFVSYLNAINVGFMEDYDNIQYKTSIGAKVQQYMAAGKIVITGSNPERYYLLHSSQGDKFFFNPPPVENTLDLSLIHI